MATWGELLAILREEYLDDTVIPFRYSDALLQRLLLQAEQEACRRGACELIFDESMTIPLTAGVMSYVLDSSILKLPRATWTSVSGTLLLEKISEESLDDFERTHWRQQAAGAPSRFYVHGRTLFLDHAPTDDDVAQDSTLTLQVWRGPQATGQTVNDEPEIGVEHHEHLCPWAAFRALQRPDEDTQNLELALINRGLFEQHFGPPIEASTLIDQLASVGYFQPSTGNAYRDHWRHLGRRWVSELG